MEEKFLFPLVILVHTQAERKQQTYKYKYKDFINPP